MQNEYNIQKQKHMKKDCIPYDSLTSMKIGYALECLMAPYLRVLVFNLVVFISNGKFTIAPKKPNLHKITYKDRESGSPTDNSISHQVQRRDK